jgi:hypothetical protein
MDEYEYQVTMQKVENGRLIERHTSNNSRLVSAIAANLMWLGGRLDQQVAELIRLLDFGDYEYWPGYQQAVADLSSAANRIYDGWKKYNNELNEG